MNSLLKRLHPANTQCADRYFAGPGIRRVERLLRSTQSAPSKVFNDEHLKNIAEEFRIGEEEKLKTKLEGLLYELDDSATIRGITEHQRIERVSASSFLPRTYVLKFLSSPLAVYLSFALPTPGTPFGHSSDCLHSRLGRSGVQRYEILPVCRLCRCRGTDKQLDRYVTGISRILKAHVFLAVFKSKSLDVKDRMGHFAFGMVCFHYLCLRCVKNNPC
jgi:hypothetical protein